jgi:hypothetical protein
MSQLFFSGASGGVQSTPLLHRNKDERIARKTSMMIMMCPSLTQKRTCNINDHVEVA